MSGAEYPGAIWFPSPCFNQGRKGAEVSIIDIHITDGGPEAKNTAESFSHVENQKSAHFVVGRAGEVYQLVSVNDRAWHDSRRNDISVGIEHCARTPGEFNSKWEGLSEHTRRALLPPPGDGWNAETDPGILPTDEQLEASARLVAWLLMRFGLGVDDVLSHCSNPKSSHRDCGKDVADGGIWPWNHYREMIRAISKLERPLNPSNTQSPI